MSESPEVTSRVLITSLTEKVGSRVKVKGWVHNIRLMGKIAFVVLRDRSGFVQVVVEDGELVKELKGLQTGTVVEVMAQVVASDKTDLGVELASPQVKFINKVTQAWPVDISKPELKVNLDTLLENRALTLRHPRQAAIFKIQGVMAQAYREYMISIGSTEYFGPAMTASSSEGGAEIFKLDYFGGEATLAQSSQLYKQMLVGVYERVFAMQKWFRAENSNTRRHLTEGVQYEFEIGFIEGIDDILVHLEAVVRFMLSQVKAKCQVELALLGTELVVTPAPEVRFPRLKFSEALKVLAEVTGQDYTGLDDFSPEHEALLCKWAKQNHGSDFIVVTNYPKGKFYAYKDEAGEYQNFDLLCRDAEIVSGGRRVDNYEKLVAEIEKEGMKPESFAEYLSIFKYGMPPHGGFGIGFERFTMLALGLDNIREASLFPSDTKRIASQQIKKKQVFGEQAIKAAVKMELVRTEADFQVITHEPTPTSEDAARVRDLPLSSGVKALILKDKKTGENYQVNIPADKKLDIKAVESYLSNQDKNVKLTFETPEVILQKFGLVVGGVPPLGYVYGLRTITDEQVFGPEQLAFNNAVQTDSIITSSKALSMLLTETGKFAQ